MIRLDLSNWYVEWCEPVVVALYKRNPIDIKKQLARAEKALYTEDLVDLDRDCLSFQLTWLEFQAHLALREFKLIEENLGYFLTNLKRSTEISDADRLRRRLYIQLRICLDRLGLLKLTLSEMDSLIEDLPESEYTTEVWLYVANWAFKYSSETYLEKAYEFAVFQAKGFNVDWSWQRVHMMLKLVRGSATQDDMLWLIDQVQIPQHLIAIRKTIWHRAEEQQLVTERVRLRYRECELELLDKTSIPIENHLRPHMASQQSITA